MKLLGKLKGGVLQLTLGISLVISMLCASAILLAYYGKLTLIHDELENILRDNAQSGIEYILANHEGLEFNEPKRLDLFDEGTDSVELNRKPWGLFEIIESKAWRGANNFSKRALITAAPGKIEQAALYVPDNNAPLYMVGDTQVKGTVYLSDRKFSTGYIDGQGFKQKKFVEGEVAKSDAFMPPFDSTLTNEIQLLTAGKQSNYIHNLKETSPGNNPFARPTQLYFSNQSIDLTDSIVGNVIVQSAFRIRVVSSAVVDGAILIAPEIDIDNGFKGSIQCFATRLITVGAESNLTYPSALVLAGGEKDSTILIRHDAKVTGLIVIRGYGKGLGSRGVFKMEKKSRFHGVAYINGAADIRGEIFGSLATRAFQVSSGVASYGGHLMDATLNGEDKSPYLPGSLSWSDNKYRLIAKWLR